MKVNRLFSGVFVLLCCLGSYANPSALAQENKTVTVINRASSPIRYIYIKGQDFLGEWSADLLGDFNVIRTNYQEDVRMDDGHGNCNLDINVWLYDRRQTTYSKVNVCSTRSLTVTDDATVNRYLKIINHTSTKIRYVYVSRPQASWGNDLLGTFITIDPDGNNSVNVYKSVPSCVLDVKITFYDDQKTSWYYRNINVCEDGTLTVVPAKQ